MSAAEPERGWVSVELAAELPGLSLLSSAVAIGRPGALDGDSPPDVEARMRFLSSRFRGARAIALRREPVTAAYRVFFRQIGLDPDATRTPMEAAVLERMLRGGFPSGGLLEDVLLVALLDTGVPVWALDASQLDGPLGLRTSVEGELLGGQPDAPLPGGRLVVADAAGALAALFAAPAGRASPGARARHIVLYSLLVPGVPALYAEEALWLARNALEGV